MLWLPAVKMKRASPASSFLFENTQMQPLGFPEGETIDRSKLCLADQEKKNLITWGNALNRETIKEEGEKTGKV